MPMPMPISVAPPPRPRTVEVAVHLHLPADHLMIDLIERLAHLSRDLGGYWEYRHGTYHIHAVEEDRP